MDRTLPNEEEKKKLQKMFEGNRLFPICVFCLAGILAVNVSLFNKHPVLQTALTGAITVAIIYALLSVVLLKKCPRCSSWGTQPGAGRHCPKCGLSLDPSLK